MATVEKVLGSVPLGQNINLGRVMPAAANMEILISRRQYVISYNRSRRSPNWVAWHLQASDIGTVGRSNQFNKDPDLEQYLASTGIDNAVDTREYNGSCFDRGHQIPSADRTSTDTDNQETFLTSNIVPQTKYLNRVIWEHLEQYTRDQIMKQNLEAYVIDGPIYDEDFGAIGPNHDIPVPSKNFKIIELMDPSSSTAVQTIAVIMPNVLKDGTKPIGSAACNDSTVSSTDKNDWQQYQTTVAEIQRLSGLQFHSH
jgi:endonuclease G